MPYGYHHALMPYAYHHALACICVCDCPLFVARGKGLGLRRQIAGERAPEKWREGEISWVSESESETMVGRERGGVGVGGDSASRNRQADEE